MTISYLTQSQLDAHLQANGNLDASVRADVIAALQADGTYTSPSDTAWVQEGAYASPTVNFVQVLDITASGTSYIQTDPALKAVVLQSPSPTQIYLTDNAGD